MSVFRFVLLALFSFRLQRIVTSDSWYPFQAWRTYLEKKAQPAHDAERQTFWTETSELFHCAWCWGWWTCVAVFVIEHFFHIPDLVVYIGAASAIVGMLATYDDS